MKYLRQALADLMVTHNRISPELAAHHAREMEASEVKFRFLWYFRERLSGAELSVAGPRLRAGNVSSTRFSRPATMTAGRAALNPVPEFRTGETIEAHLPDSETENRGKSGANETFASGERLDHPDGVGFGFASRV